jgi:hypothetical protein
MNSEEVEKNIENQSDLTTHAADSGVGKQMRSETQAEQETSAKRQERNALPYISASSCTPIGAVVPTKLSYETIESLNTFILDDTDTANFVKEKLKYNSRVAVCDAFASEQVDALALAITQIENGKGFILGDMAGTGKGRVVAGICRYAIQNKKIPIFFTIGANLFSDIFRDFSDIGGIDNSQNLPIPFIFNTDGKIERENDLGDLKTLHNPYTTKETVAYCRKGTMPKNTNIVLTTYSQFGGNVKDTAKKQNLIAKFEFLCGIAPNSIFILDESHKGAGESSVGKNLSEMLSLSSGVMFASATYSKVPKSLNMYIPFTDISDSTIRPKTIVEAIKDNGEIVQEYIAGLLVKSGQMIRRQRTFDGCGVSYKYIDTEPKKYYYDMYDGLMKLYNRINEFATSELYQQAVNDCIVRYAKMEGIEVVSSDDKKPTNKEDEAQWKTRNAKKYLVEFNTTNVLNGRFVWVENLLFSLKAVFVADQVIESLLNRENIEYIENNEKTVKYVNHKPVIALRNTGESAMKLLGYKSGQKISKSDNDYAKTLTNIAKALVVAEMTFKPAVSKTDEIIIPSATILNSDFADYGLVYDKLKMDLSKAVSGLPLSPIDAIIDKIESTPRPNWDMDYTRRETYKVEEITKRGLHVKKIAENEFEIITPEKSSIVNKVANFNSGMTDVLIINTAGSTGLSIHSSSKFEDKRPRIMLIQQVELDVNTEVQKWGRINRTGQVNKPSYKYIVSPIPAEIRKLMMLRRKLRSLDANTSGNAKQSSTQSEILDKNGDAIEDMTNKYGYQVLLEFLRQPQNSHYKEIEPKGWFDAKGSADAKFEAYLRALEKMSCKDQEEFYDQMNAAYKVVKDTKVEEDEWDVDADIEDLRSSTYNKKLLLLGNNENEFTKSVYIEDKFVQSKGKPYTKEELNDAVNKYCGGKNIDAWHSDLLDEFDEYSDKSIEEIRLSYGEPNFENASTEEQREVVVATHNEKISIAVSHANERFREIRRYLVFFKPMRPVPIPVDNEMLADSWKDDKDSRKFIPYYGGIVVGINFLTKSENKFTPMNIQIEFATLTKIKPKSKITLTKQYENIILWTISSTLSKNEIDIVKAWIIPKKQDREMMRVLSGELFKGLEMANQLAETNNNYQGKKRLIKYTTATGGTESSVKLWVNSVELLSKEGNSPPTFIALNKQGVKGILDYIQSLKNGVTYIHFGDANQWFRVVKYDDEITIDLEVLTGYAYQGKRAKKEWISVLSLTETKNDLADIFQVMPMVNWKWTERPNKSAQFKNAEHTIYRITQDNIDVLNKLFSYFDTKYDWYIQNNINNKDFVIYEAQDVYKQEEDDVEEKAGEYKYYPISPFNENDAPDNYIQGSYTGSDNNRYGEITLSFPTPLIYRPQYKIVPADVTELEGVKSIINQITNDAERENYIKMVKESSSFTDIAIFTQKLLGFSPKFALGNVDTYESGRIIYENIVKASKKDTSSSEESKKVETKTEVELPKIPLDWETAQDFIIKLKSL